MSGGPSGEPWEGRGPSEGEQLLEVMGHKATREILLALETSPMSVRKLSRAVDLPQSTMYFNLHRLQRLGLISVDRVARSGRGRPQAIQRSRVGKIEIRGFGRV